MEFPWGLFLFDNGTFLSYGAKSVKKLKKPDLMSSNNESPCFLGLKINFSKCFLLVNSEDTN